VSLRETIAISLIAKKALTRIRTNKSKSLRIIFAGPGSSIMDFLLSKIKIHSV
jgi:hypothetical protein